MDRYVEVLQARPGERRRALLLGRGRLPGGPVQGGHRSRPPLALASGRDRPGAQHDRQGAGRAGPAEGGGRGLRRAIACDIKFAEAYGNRGNMLFEPAARRGAEELRPGARARAERGRTGSTAAPRSPARPARRGDRQLRPGHRAGAGRSASPTSTARTLCCAPAGREEALATGRARRRGRAEGGRTPISPGRRRMALGQPEAALAGIDRALGHRSSSPTAHRARAALLAALGRAEEGRANLERAEALEGKARRGVARFADNQPVACGHNAIWGSVLRTVEHQPWSPP